MDGQERLSGVPPPIHNETQRGQSLIVWAIAEGRSAARGLDLYLMGHSDLPAPLP